MNVSDSELFRNFARPVLQHPYGTCTERIQGIMDGIIQAFINRTKLEITLIRITEATEG